MVSTLACITIGALIGLFYRAEWLQKVVSMVQKYIVYVLIFFMGLGIGLDGDLIANVGKIGLGAAVFAVVCGVLSVFCTLAFDRVIRGRQGRQR